MEVIAKSIVHTKRKLAKGVTIGVALVSLLTLGGCVGGGMDYLASAKVDRSVSTGTVPTAPVTTDSISDESTVRNAVSSADLHKLNGQPIPWANASTVKQHWPTASPETRMLFRLPVMFRAG